MGVHRQVLQPGDGKAFYLFVKLFNKQKNASLSISKYSKVNDFPNEDRK